MKNLYIYLSLLLSVEDNPGDVHIMKWDVYWNLTDKMSLSESNLYLHDTYGTKYLILTGQEQRLFIWREAGQFYY